MTGYVAFLLYLDQFAVSAVKAKAEGVPIAEVVNQPAQYAFGLPSNIPHVILPLPFFYESTGVETFFRDNCGKSRVLGASSRSLTETITGWLS